MNIMPAFKTNIFLKQVPEFLKPARQFQCYIFRVDENFKWYKTRCNLTASLEEVKTNMYKDKNEIPLLSKKKKTDY